MVMEIRKPAGFAFIARRNAEIDAWRRARVDSRRVVVSRILRDELATYYAEVTVLRRLRCAAALILENCPIKGASEYAEYLLYGTAPRSDVRRRERAAWDKRIQRCRVWLLGRLTPESAEILRRARGKHRPRPTFWSIYRRLR